MLTFPPRDDTDAEWCFADDLCEDISNSYDDGERLNLAVSDDRILVYASDEKEEELRANPILQPSKTLKELLQSGAFLGPEVAWWNRLQKFNETEKRALVSM